MSDPSLQDPCAQPLDGLAIPAVRPRLGRYALSLALDTGLLVGYAMTVVLAGEWIMLGGRL